MVRKKNKTDRRLLTKQTRQSEDDESRRKEHELKQLTDSLSSFFTPTTCRRGIKQLVDGGTVSDSDDKKDEEKRNRKKSIQQPLSVEVNLSDTSSASPSPVKKLQDSLSPYFSATNEKRRTVKKGEFLSLSTGRRHKSPEDNPSESLAVASTSREEEPMSEKRRGQRSADIGRVVGRRRTQNSASAALFGTPEKELQEEEPIVQGKRPRTPKEIYSPKIERKSSRSFVYRDNPLDGISSDTEQLSLKENKKQRVRKKKENQEDKENCMQVGNISITGEQMRLFDTVRAKVAEEIDRAESRSHEYQEKVDKEPRLPRAIRFGKFLIQTWYSSPYPMEYIHVPVLYMCDFCLKFVKTESIMTHHLRKCTQYHPPGTEIYRKDNLSVFEVDGNMEKTYCQNLCLLSKSFLDHKTLFYDVEPFLFYVVTKNDAYGCHFVGYFSKEKYSMQKFNLSCIVTLPCYQKQGFGRFLIDFSFLLSRREKMPGTPERPLSDLGRISYASYWRTALFEWIHEHVDENRLESLSMNEISEGTGISAYDIVEMFDALGWLTEEDGEVQMEIDFELINEHWKKVVTDKSRIWIDESCLKWTPRVYSPSKDNFRSPNRAKEKTPMKTPPSANTTSTPSGVSLAAVGSTIKSGCGVSTMRRVGRNLKERVEEQLQQKTIELPEELMQGTDSDESEAGRRGRRRRVRCKENDEEKTWKDDEESPDEGRRRKKDVRKLEKGRRMRLGGSEKKFRGKMMYEGEENDGDEEEDLEGETSSDEEYFAQKGKPQKGRTGKKVEVKEEKQEQAREEEPKVEEKPEEPQISERRISSTSMCPGASSATSDSEDESSSEAKVPQFENDTIMTPMSSNTDDSAASSRAETPGPIGDVMVNMGFVPEEEKEEECTLVEIEEPPRLDLEGGKQAAQVDAEPAPEAAVACDDEEPPMLAAQQVTERLSLDDEDEAPPMLSPNFGKTEQDEINEKEKMLEAMDRPPMAPAAVGQMDEEEKMYHQQLSAANGQMSVGPLSYGAHYSGSMQQATPSSSGIPSCGQIYNQTTPEQQQQHQKFMSPMGSMEMQPEIMTSQPIGQPQQQMSFTSPESQGSSRASNRRSGSETKKRMQSQQQQQVGSHQQPQQNFAMHMPFQPNLGYPPGYATASYPYPVDMYAWQQYYGVLPQYYPPAQMNQAPAAWARYPNGTPGGSMNQTNQQFAQMNATPAAAAAFGQIPSELTNIYNSNFYMQK